MAGQNYKQYIESTKEFMQLWLKFHQLYKEAMSKSAISPEEEKTFLDTKSVIARKFQTLIDEISIDRLTIDHTYDVINQILTLESLSTLSEETLKNIENNWHESYISLNRLLGHLEAQLDLAKAGQGSAAVKATRSFVKNMAGIAVVAVFALVIIFLLYILGILK